MTFKLVASAFALLSLAAAPADAGRRGEHEAAYSAARSGNILPFPEIKHRVMPRMGGASLMGFDYDETSAVYTLKLMRGGSVIWVDVDARTGSIIGRAGE